MAEDFVHELFETAMKETIQEKIENGASEEQMEELAGQQNCNKTYKALVEQVSDDSVKTIESIMYEKVIKERTFTDEFMARQNQKWGDGFVASDVLYICIIESAESYRDYVVEIYGQEVSYLYHALANIHGRALQIYAEIMCLNKNGYADGAYARWRSLYELSVIAAFISENGEKVAESFVKSADKENGYEWARIAKSFRKYRTDWKVTFKSIQLRCKFIAKEWEKEYGFVNKLVHASPQGTMYRMGADTSRAIPIGRSDKGMAISAIHSAMSLVQITKCFFTVFPHGDSTVAVLTFHKWVDKIIEYYQSVEDSFSSDEDENKE